MTDCENVWKLLLRFIVVSSFNSILPSICSSGVIFVSKVSKQIYTRRLKTVTTCLIFSQVHCGRLLKRACVHRRSQRIPGSEQKLGA